MPARRVLRALLFLAVAPPAAGQVPPTSSSPAEIRAALLAGEYDRAVVLAEKAAGGDASDRVRGRWRLARLFEKQGKKDEAVAALRRAVEVDPGYDRARKDLERLTKG